MRLMAKSSHVLLLEALPYLVAVPSLNTSVNPCLQKKCLTLDSMMAVATVKAAFLRAPFTLQSMIFQVAYISMIHQMGVV